MEPTEGRTPTLRSTRRTFLAGMAATAAPVAAIPALAAAGDDADLLRLGADFDRLVAEWVQLQIEADDREQIVISEGLQRGWFTLDWKNRARLVKEHFDDVCALDRASGLNAANDAAEKVAVQVDAVASAAATLPPRTAAGLAVRARCARWHLSARAFLGEFPEDDFPLEATHAFLDLVESFAGGRAAA
jgi:hypothetical protein